MKKIKVLAVITIAILIILICNIVEAEDLETLEGKRIQIQEQITEQNTQMEELQSKMTEALEQLSSLDEKIEGYENDLTALNVELIDIYKDVEKVQEKLSNIETDYALQKKSLEQRLVALYEAGETSYLDVLLHSSSLSDFVSNYYLISEIAEYDEDLLNNIERERRAIAEAKKILEDKKESLRKVKDNKEKTIIAIENTKIIRNDYVKRLTAEEIEVQSKIDEFRNELNSIDREILALAMINIDGTYVGGEFAWPTPGYYTITSRYGMRIHPIFKYSRMHSGTDIGAPMGANIIAANDGLVVKATYTEGYGNMVMIDHGGGISTVYGHGSEIIAKVGDYVKRGDVIMKVGSTGWSTGPHLHFEVRINGVCVDSLPYITRQVTIPTNNIDTNTDVSE